MTPAQDLAAQGFSVFPVVEGGKRPAIKQWPAKATADAERIRRWWARKPYNVGVYTGHRLHNGTRRHLVVLDLDNKNGADGVAELARLAARHGGLPATFTTETPTNGRHVWFHTSRPIGTNAGSLAPGVDIRGVGGFVVGPGSTVAGGVYRVIDARDVADCPLWLEQLLPHPGPAAGGKGQATTKLPGIDPKRAAARCVDYLAALEPVGEGGRNNAAFRAAAKCKDLGADAGECVELMLEHWPCEPMLDLDELQQVVRSAYTNSANPQGADAAEAVFEPVDDPTAGEPRKESRFKPLRISDLRNLPWPEWAVRNVIPASGIGLIYGPSKSGKTFLALDIALACVRGIPWAGLPTRQGVAVYVGLEGQARTRAFAYATKYGLPDSDLDDLILFEQPPLNMLDSDKQGSSVAELIRQVKAATSGRPVVMTIVDTLAQATPGGDENSSVMMSAAISNAKRIARELGGVAVLTHHSGKQEGAGARGHSSLTAAADFEIAVSRPNDGALRFAKVTKVKDAEDGAQWSFGLEVVVLGEGPRVDGCEPEIRSSCVVRDLVPVPHGQAQGQGKGLTPTQQAVMFALNLACEGDGLNWDGTDTCTGAEWRAAYDDRTPLDDEPERGGIDGAKERRRKNFDAAKKRLIELRKVEQMSAPGGVARYRPAPG